MDTNADFARRAAVHAAENPWVASPMPGVERRMLDRVGAELARATSIVRYAPHSRFSPHTHDGGEEFLVLEGVFQDEHGDYPVGTYVRNPPSTRHTPGSEAGCTILVKLWQFDPKDRTKVRLDTNALPFRPDLVRPGVAAQTLFLDSHEEVRIERWDPETPVTLDATGGLELFVLEGAMEESDETFERFDWLRLPPGSTTQAIAGPEGCRVWLKVGHLTHPILVPAAAAPLGAG